MKIAFLLLALLWIPGSTSARQAHWIGIQGAEVPNTWTALHKSFTLESVPSDARARIAVDSKYRLWVNGELVLFEGGLNRGPTPRDTWIDEIDLKPFLRPGKNAIAALVWFWGRDGFYHHDSGRGGLYFETSFGVVSDASWQARVHPAFERSEQGPQPNFRHAAWNIRFNGARDLEDWLSPDADTSSWPAAVLGPAPPASPWGTLVARSIPHWRVSDLRPYVEVRHLPHPRRKERVLVHARLPWNAQVSPFLEVRAQAGLTIDLRSDHYKGGGAPNLRAEYLTREGLQSFEVPFWINGHEIIYDLPREVEILRLAWRESGYDTDFVGTFASNDPFLDRLLEKSRRTLYVNLRDTFMDCPDRERAPWWADITLQMDQGFYALDRRVDALGAKAIRELVAWSRPSGVLFSPVPSDGDRDELPMQMLASIGHYGFWNYILHTGDNELATEVLPHAVRYLELWAEVNHGLVAHRAGGWDWADWGENIDVPVLENAWYALALRGVRDLASFTGEVETARRLEARLQRLTARFDDAFWDGTAYRSSAELAPDDRGNALAVLAELAPNERSSALRAVLMEQRHASPYMEKYVIEALFQLDAADLALARLRERYAEMVESSHSTLWEHWQPKRHTSYNHAWSGGPLSLLPREAVGLAPTSPGWRTCSLAPRLGDLEWAEASVQTVRGLARAEIRRIGDRKLRIEVENPCERMHVKAGVTDLEIGRGAHTFTIRLDSD